MNIITEQKVVDFLKSFSLSKICFNGKSSIEKATELLQEIMKKKKMKTKTIKLDISGTITLNINVDEYEFPRDIQEILGCLKVVGNKDLEITKTIIDGYSVCDFRDFSQH